MLFEALSDSVRYPVVWLAAAGYAALDGLQLVLTLRGETFFSVRLLVLEYAVLPFLLAGVYGVLRERRSSVRALAEEGARNYFRVLLPALVVGFATVLLLLVILALLQLVATPVSTDLAAGATIAVLIPVVVFFSLYDTAACLEHLGVLASLRRSVALVLAHLGKVAVFLLTMLAVLFAAGFALAVAWTTVLFSRLEPLAGMTPADLTGFGPADLAAMIGPEGVALSVVLYALFMLFAFVLVTSSKARLFRDVAEATPPEVQGVWDEKGRYYRY